MIDFIQNRISTLLGKSSTGPLNIYIETHSSCTNNCFMCPRQSKTMHRKPMKEEDFKNIIALLKNNNFNGELHLYGQNEPFLDKNLIDKIYYSHQELPNAKIVIISNFTVLTEQLINDIIKAPIHNFSCSTYAFSREDYKKICNKDNFIKAFTNQVKFLKKFAEVQPFSFANYIIENQYNKHDIDFIDYFLFNVTPASFIQKGKSCQLFNSPNNTLPLSNEFYAPCLYRDLKITSDKEFSICPCDINNLLSIGNLNDFKTDNLKIIYNNKLAQNIRKRMNSKELSQKNYCQYCDFARSITFFDYLIGKETKYTSKNDIYNHKNKTYRNSPKEITEKAKIFNEIFKDGDEENWINCLNELRRKFYAKEL